MQDDGTFPEGRRSELVPPFPPYEGPAPSGSGFLKVIPLPPTHQALRDAGRGHHNCLRKHAARERYLAEFGECLWVCEVHFLPSSTARSWSRALCTLRRDPAEDAVWMPADEAKRFQQENVWRIDEAYGDRYSHPSRRLMAAFRDWLEGHNRRFDFSVWRLVLDLETRVRECLRGGQPDQTSLPAQLALIPPCVTVEGPGDVGSIGFLLWELQASFAVAGGPGDDGDGSPAWLEEVVLPQGPGRVLVICQSAAAIARVMLAKAAISPGEWRVGNATVEEVQKLAESIAYFARRTIWVRNQPPLTSAAFRDVVSHHREHDKITVVVVEEGLIPESEYTVARSLATAIGTFLVVT